MVNLDLICPGDIMAAWPFPGPEDRSIPFMVVSACKLTEFGINVLAFYMHPSVGWRELYITHETSHDYHVLHSCHGVSQVTQTSSRDA
jgi:hypothetical protein